MRKTAAAMIAALSTAAVANAQQGINWSWTVSDTGNGNGIIEPGEQGIFRLQAQVVGAPMGYLAGSVFNVMNTGGMETGAYTTMSRNASLTMNPMGGGVADPMGNITGVDVFQMALPFNPFAATDNPITVYTLHWTPTDYTPRSVSATSMHLTNEIYADLAAMGGTAVVGTPAVLVAQVVPAPGAMALLSVAGLTIARRRRG